ncbi:hypothetical protein AAMO2058_001038400 [Amorphochlora amoebiformis]
MIILRGRQRLCPAVFIMAFAILFWWKAVRRVGEKFGKTYRKARAKIHKKREEWLEKIRKLDPDNKDPYERRGMVTDEQLRWIRKKLQRPLYNQDLHPLKWDGKYITDSGLVVQVEQIDGQLRATAAAAWSPAKGTFHEDMGNTVTMLGMHATLGKDGIVRWENGRKWLSYEAKEMALWKMKFRSFFSQPNAFNVNTSLPHRVTDLVHLDFSINDRPAGRVLIGLYGDVAPITCENFRALCTGEKGESRLGTDLTYKESYIHRIVPGFLIQGGDIVRGDGRSGESIYGKYFPDETFQVKHDRAFVVSMANAGNDTNQSQFFITLKKSPWLDGKNVAFGSVLLGQEVIYRISQQVMHILRHYISNISTGYAHIKTLYIEYLKRLCTYTKTLYIKYLNRLCTYIKTIYLENFKKLCTYINTLYVEYLKISCTYMRMLYIDISTCYAYVNT